MSARTNRRASVEAHDTPAAAATDLVVHYDDPRWRALVMDCRTKYAAWFETIDFADRDAGRFKAAAVALPPEPQEPRSAAPEEVLDMTVRQIRDLDEVPAIKAARAAYEQDHAAWAKKRDALHQEVVGPGQAQYDAAYRAYMKAFNVMTTYRVRSCNDLAEKIELVASDAGGDTIQPEYLTEILADVRHLAGRDSVKGVARG